MSTSNGHWQNRARIEWEYTYGAESGGRRAVTVRAYLRMDQYASTAMNGSKAWSGTWGSGSGPQGFYLGPNQRVLIVQGTTQVALLDTPRTVAFGVSASHWHGTTTSTLSFTLPARSPNAPSGLAVVRESDTRHRLNWSRNSTYTSVQIHRRENDGSWQHVGTANGNAFTWTDTTTRANRQYQYRVRGRSQGGTSGYSGTATVYTTPAAPTGITAARSGFDIQVAASGRPPYATSYDVDDNGTVVATSVAVPWLHVSPAASAVHRYRVRAKRGSLVSAWSDWSNTVALLAAPNAPTLVAPTGDPGVAPTRFEWVHNPVDTTAQAAAEIQYREIGAGSWTTETVTTALSLTVDLPPGGYEWRARTQGGHASFSPYSETARFEVIDQPTVAIVAPTGVTHRPEPVVEWSWYQAQSRPQSAYEVELLSEFGDLLASLSGAGDAMSVALAYRMDNEGVYVVRVRAAAGRAWSDWSEETIEVEFISPPAPFITGEWVEDDGKVALEVDAGIPNDGPNVQNLFTNPDFEATSGPIEMARNHWTTNPGCRGTIRPLNGSVGSAWTHGNVADGLSRSGRMCSLRYALSSGGATTLWAGLAGLESARLADPDGRVTIALIMRTNNSITPATAGTAIMQGSSVWDEAPGPDGIVWVTVRKSTPFDSSDRINLGINAVSPHALRVLYGELDAYPGVYQPGRQWFDGGYTPDSDLTPRWVGAADASASVLEGQAVAGVTTAGCVAIQSDQWAKTGTKSLRLIPTGQSTQAFARIDIPVDAQDAGTLLATRRQDAVIAGSTHPVALQAGFGQTVPVENVVGATDYRLVYDGLTGVPSAYLWHGGTAGSGDVWWDLACLIPGEWDGPAFTGSSGMITTPTGIKGTRWDGVPHQSTSSTVTVIPETERVDVQRSVDGGSTWEPVIDGVTEYTMFEDPESLTNGVTRYRGVAYSDLGASSATEIDVRADSPAVWLSGDEGYGLTGRLPYDPVVKIDAQRARSVQRYEGRSLGVPYAGSHVTRRVDVSGTLLHEDDANATLERMQALALSEWPVHLYRDPDGRRIYGVIQTISLPRDTGTSDGALWGYAFDLEETSK